MTVVLSGNLRRYTSFEDEIELDAPSVGAALRALVTQHPALAPVLFDGEGKVRSVHRLFLNGEILDVDAEDHPLTPTDELGVLTAIAGG